MYKSIIIRRGSGGWGGPITLIPTDENIRLLALLAVAYIHWHKLLLTCVAAKL